MSKARRTVKVSKVQRACQNRINADLSRIDSLKTMTPEQAFRFGVAAVLEGLLHDTGNYSGYCELDPTDSTKRAYGLSRVVREDYDNNTVES